MRRRRAFTYIEVCVMLIIVLLFAAMITPNVVNMKANQSRRAIYGQLLDFARRTRENAIEGGRTYALSYDGTQSAFVMRREPVNPAASQSMGAIAAPSSRPLSNVQSVSDLEKVDTLNLPASVKADTFRVGTDSVDAGGWLVHFYPDGTSDGGGAQLSEGGATTQSLEIGKDGLSKLDQGALPDVSQETWPAGTYAPQG